MKTRERTVTTNRPKKTAQAFTLDLLLGVVIMTLALLALTVYTNARGAPFTEDAERINTLMTEGVPEDWNETTVVITGFLTDDRFNRTKIEAFASLAPETQRALLGIRANASIRFANASGAMPLCATCGALPNADSRDVLPLRRYGLLDGEIVRMEVTLYR